jgi:predicted negative regulator of RcsB-dependent stress response
MTPRQHGDTETRLEGFEARLQDGFAWVNAHGREIMAAIAAALLVGGLVAGVVEWRSRQGDAAQTELAAIESRFTAAMGANPGEYFVPEPANAEQAAKAREAALAELDAFIAAHAGSALAAIAGIKAAELQVDLGELDAADARLAKLVEPLGADDPKRAIALRLRGYTLDQRGQTLAAAEIYADAAKVQAYPARGLLWIEAGDCFARANAPDRAIAAYREALASAPELSEQQNIVQRIGIQQAKLDAAPPPAPAPSPVGPATP